MDGYQRNGWRTCGKNVEAVDRVRRKGGEPFQSRALEGGDVYKATWVMYTLRCSSGSVSPV